MGDRETDQDRLEAEVTAQHTGFAESMHAAVNGEVEPSGDYDEPRDIFEVVDGDVLEIAVEWERSPLGDTPEPANIVFVLGTGGPHVELAVEVDSPEKGELRGYWGSSRVIRRVWLGEWAGVLLETLEDVYAIG